MKARDLERLLIERGAGAAKIDAITRRLRQIGRLPKGGRGQHAPEVGAAESAAMLLSLAGSTKGAEAELRLAKLEALPGPASEGCPTLLGAITSLLESGKRLTGLVEVRVSRTSRRAVFIYDDGCQMEFGSERSRSAPANFLVEGVLPARLLEDVASELGKLEGNEK